MTVQVVVVSPSLRRERKWETESLQWRLERYAGTMRKVERRSGRMLNRLRIHYTGALHVTTRREDKTETGR